jgi:glycosyltransferase involved in cell wall biosynthesis
VSLSVVIIAHNEETNLGRTLASVRALVGEGKGEIIVVDSGSTDRTVEIAKSFGAKVFVEDWKGYAAQKNSAIDKATGDWILSLDADEEPESGLIGEIQFLFGGAAVSTGPAARIERARALTYLSTKRTLREMRSKMKEQGNPDSFFAPMTGYWIARKNLFLGRWMRRGGFWPDRKLRLFRRGVASFEDRAVHEDAIVSEGITGSLRSALLHHSYPTLSDYIDHMNRYSSLGAEMGVADGNGKVRFSLINIMLRPLATFIYNYFFRLGFLDGREGLLLHLYHAAYVSWKYSKAWELSRNPLSPAHDRPVV